jgi:pimeloyl-ACP methyl ester carboxylesterase
VIAAARRAAARLADPLTSSRLEVVTDDGLDLHVRLHRARPQRAQVVMCHGITSDCWEGGLFTKFARQAAARGISVIRFDFRGHGRSGGSDRDFSLSGQRRDLAAVLSRNPAVDGGPTFLLGMSFGVSPAVAKVAAGGYDGLLLWSPTVDYARSCLEPSTPWAEGILANRDDPSLPEWAWSTLPRTGFRLSKSLAAECASDDTFGTLRSLRIPVLAFSARDDAVVPYQPMAEVAALNPEIDFRPIDHDVHGLTRSRTRVISESLDWLDQRIGGS